MYILLTIEHAKTQATDLQYFKILILPIFSRIRICFPKYGTFITVKEQILLSLRSFVLND